MSTLRSDDGVDHAIYSVKDSQGHWTTTSADNIPGVSAEIVDDKTPDQTTTWLKGIQLGGWLGCGQASGSATLADLPTTSFAAQTWPLRTYWATSGAWGVGVTPTVIGSREAPRVIDRYGMI